MLFFSLSSLSITCWICCAQIILWSYPADFPLSPPFTWLWLGGIEIFPSLPRGHDYLRTVVVMLLFLLRSVPKRQTCCGRVLSTFVRYLVCYLICLSFSGTRRLIEHVFVILFTKYVIIFQARPYCSDNYPVARTLAISFQTFAATCGLVDIVLNISLGDSAVIFQSLGC